MNCWFEPQSAYLAPHFVYAHQLSRFDRVVRASSERGCNVVLRYENLSSEFAVLMDWLGLNVRLPPQQTSRPRPGRATDSTCFTAGGARKLLSAATRSIVSRWYGGDFALLGYTDSEAGG